jgi:hypothetical protein
MIVYIYTFLIIFFIISNFISNSILSLCIGVLAFIAIIFSFFRAKGLYLYSGVCFLIIGFILFIYNDLPWYSFFLQFETMLGMLSLFLVLPFINCLIRVGAYDKNLSLLLQHGIKDLSILYRRSFIVCHFLGLFLNIATLPLLTNSLRRTLHELPNKITDKFYTENLLRAYALCLTWSPLEIMVITSLDITNINYYKLFPIIFSIAVIALLIDWTLSHFKYSKVPVTIENKTEINIKKVYRKIAELLVMLFILVLLATIIQQTFNKGFLFSVVILLIPISFTWALFLGKSKRYISITIPHWKVRTMGLSNYFFMFLSAGLFVEMVSVSHSLSFLQSAFNVLSDLPLLFYLMIAVYFLITAFIGFHPLVSLTLLIELLSPILSAVSSVSLTVVLISCSLSTVLFSPYNLSVSILADELKLNPYKMGMWNILYAISYMLLSISIAYLLTFIG